MVSARPHQIDVLLMECRPVIFWAVIWFQELWFTFQLAKSFWMYTPLWSAPNWKGPPPSSDDSLCHLPLPCFSAWISNGAFAVLEWRGLQWQLKIKSASIHVTTGHHALSLTKEDKGGGGGGGGGQHIQMHRSFVSSLGCCSSKYYARSVISDESTNGEWHVNENHLAAG